MDDITPLVPDDLRRRCDPTRLGFQTTAGLPPVDPLSGQDRAADALRFATAMQREGYNLFVIGEPGMGHEASVRRFLEECAGRQDTPDDWAYVNNFEVSDNPRALRLPSGTAVPFRDAMDALIEDLKSALPSLFETEDYQTRIRAINDEARERQEQAFESLREKAEAEDIAIIRTPMGLALAPTRDGNVVPPEEFKSLDEKERKRVEALIQELQGELETVLREMPAIDKARRDQVRTLNIELASATVNAAVAGVEQQFEGIDPIIEHLEATKSDLVHNAGLFLQTGRPEETAMMPVQAGPDSRDPHIRRYGVNVLVANGAREGAPVVVEEHPSLGNLLGRIEHRTEMGALITDFMLIKPGALHRANGGFVMLDARKLLTEPFAWEALKRTLRGNAIRIETMAEQLGFATTVTLEPEPVPLDLKVILMGERFVYDLLVHRDPDFGELFKVEADFEDRWARTAENERQLAQLVTSIVQSEKLRPLDAGGAARLIEQAARLADDAERLSLKMGQLADILREADFWAAEGADTTIGASHVQRALDARTRRRDRMRDRVYEAIQRETLLIDTSGEAIGQINGLAVTGIGDFLFGKPSRITARVRVGSGRVIDIEREVELGGPLHSKGVMILGSYLNAHFALDVPLSLWASLVFEQSYGGVDGDSASSAELYALLSALSGVPIRQSLAVTGSVNQLGKVQAIGGVNEKIEGFFDICRGRGLEAGHGVLIPRSNIKHLMLREDVVEAAEAGTFSIFGVSTIDEGIAILTGRAAGERDSTGAFPPDTINGLVEDRLRAFAKSRRSFADGGDNGRGNTRD